MKDDKGQEFFDALAAEIEQMKKNRAALSSAKEINGKVYTLMTFDHPNIGMAPIDNTRVTIDNGRFILCHYCARPISKYHITRDHIVPRSKGGRSTKANLIDACRKCNNMKGSMDYVEFIAYRLKQGLDTSAKCKEYMIRFYPGFAESFLKITNKQ